MGCSAAGGDMIWTDTEVSILRNIALTGGDCRKAQIALNRSKGSIWKKVHGLGLDLCRHAVQKPWTAVASKIVRQGYRDGLSAQQIGEKCGYGRSAVIGAAHRMGLTHSAYARRELRRQSGHQAPALYIVTPGRSTPAPAAYLCQYPAGDAPDWRWCGKKPQEGSSYCKKHHEICHRREVAAPFVRRV